MCGNAGEGEGGGKGKGEEGSGEKRGGGRVEEGERGGGKSSREAVMYDLSYYNHKGRERGEEVEEGRRGGGGGGGGRKSSRGWREAVMYVMYYNHKGRERGGEGSDTLTPLMMFPATRAMWNTSFSTSLSISSAQESAWSEHKSC